MLRLIIATLLTAILAPTFGATVDTPLDLSGSDKNALVGKTITYALTSQEDTLTISSPNIQHKVQIFTESNKWRVSNASGVASTKTPIQAKQIYTATIIPPGQGGSGVVKLYWAADSTADTIYVVVIE